MSKKRKWNVHRFFEAESSFENIYQKFPMLDPRNIEAGQNDVSVGVMMIDEYLDYYHFCEFFKGRAPIYKDHAEQTFDELGALIDWINSKDFQGLS
jgi:hypothetical protein